VIPNTGQVLDSATTNEHNRVLLEIVTLTTNVGGDLITVGQPDAGNLTVVYTRVQTPRFCGQACSAGTFDFSALRLRGLRTSWLIVAIGCHGRT